MKKALWKDSIKEIVKTKKRFISILVMAFLGVGFFAGIRATSPDMLKTVNDYYEKQNVYDIEILSTLGLTEEDKEALEKIEGVKKVEGSYSQDAFIKVEEAEYVTKIIGLTEANTPKQKEGRMPENEKECVVEESFLMQTQKKIGDTIQIEESDLLKENTLTIVGIVESPIYISRERGSSTLGAGKVNFFLYVDSKNIAKTDVYTEIYVTTNTHKITGTAEYEKEIENVTRKIEEIKEVRQKERYEEIVVEAQEEVDKAEKELLDKKQEAEEQIQEAENTIASSQKEIEENETKIEKKEKEANQKFKSAEVQLADAKVQLSTGKETYVLQKETANTKKEELQNKVTVVNSSISSLEEKIKNMQTAGATEEELKELKEKIETLKTTQKTLTAGILQIEQTLKKAEEKLAQSEIQLEQKTKELQNAKREAQKQIASAKAQIKEAKSKLQEGEAELQTKKQEAQEKIQEGQDKIEEAKKEIQDIEEAKWYILDRQDNIGYNSFMQDTKSIENVAQLFPLIFFVIATLISLNTMTRMVDEQRGQIGILKALGYNKLQIATKYIVYALLASAIGGVFGMLVRI